MKEESEVIKWKISSKERISQNFPDRKQIVIQLRKDARATKESREKSRHLRNKCSCDSTLCPFMANWLKTQEEKRKNKE
jgi:hypothetical protein